MNLHTDIPTHDQVGQLLEARHPAPRALFRPTRRRTGAPSTSHAEASWARWTRCSWVPGTIDEATGAVAFSETDDAVVYGVVDEIARRVWRTGRRVLAVRREDVPGGGTAAAILRYAV